MTACTSNLTYTRLMTIRPDRLYADRVCILGEAFDARLLAAYRTIIFALAEPDCTSGKSRRQLYHCEREDSEAYQLVSRCAAAAFASAAIMKCLQKGKARFAECIIPHCSPANYASSCAICRFQVIPLPF